MKKDKGCGWDIGTIEAIEATRLPARRLETPGPVVLTVDIEAIEATRLPATPQDPAGSCFN